MAIYYVDKIMPDDTGITKRTVGAAITAAGLVAGPHTINIAAGVYDEANDYISITAANLANATIVGAGDDITIIKSPAAQSTLFGDTRDGVTVSGLTLSPTSTKNAIQLTNGADNWTLDCTCSSADGHTGTLVYLASCLGFNVKRLVTRHNIPLDVNKSVVRVTGSAAGKINNLTMEFPGEISTNGFWTDSTGNMELNNSILGGGSYPLLKQGTGTLTENNNIKFGTCLVTGTAPTTISAGALSVNSTLALGSAYTPTTLYSGTPTKDAKTIELELANPKLSNFGKVGYIIPCCDDAKNLAYVLEFEAMLDAKGWHGTWFFESEFWNTAENDDLRALVARGTIEIGVHSHSHSDLTFTGGFWTTSTAISINRATDTITTAGGTLTGFKTKTLAVIRAELQAAPHSLTVTPVSGKYETNGAGAIDNSALGEILADSTSSTSVTVLIDPTCATGFFKSEMVDSRTMIEGFVNGGGDIIDPQTGLKYFPQSFAYPYNTRSTNSIAATKAAGYKIARAFGFNSLSKYNLHTALSMTAVIGATVAETKQRMYSLLACAAYYGQAVYLLSHTSAEIPTQVENGWQAIFEAIEEFGDNIQVKSSQEFAEIVRNSPWSYNDTTGISSRTYTDRPNLHLQPTSPCIGTGVAINGIHTLSTPATDADGNIVHFLPPNIGPYDGRTTKSVSTNYSPTGYEVRGTSTSPATIKITADNVTVDLSGLTPDEEIIVKAGTKKVGGFVGKSDKHYLKGSGGGSSNGVFNHVFG